MLPTSLLRFSDKSHPDLLLVFCCFLRSVCQKKKPFQLSVVKFQLTNLSTWMGVNSHLTVTISIIFLTRTGLFRLPQRHLYPLPILQSMHMEATLGIFFSNNFSMRAFCAAHHAPSPNFNLTFFRPHVGMQPELDFLWSCHVGFLIFKTNSHPHRFLANFTKTRYGICCNKKITRTVFTITPLLIAFETITLFDFFIPDIFFSRKIAKI